MADKKETIILDFEVDSDDAVVSIEKLTAANKALVAERKKVDLSTEEGVKRIKDINAQLDKNNQVIKSNSDTLTQNRLNVGNYTASIKDAIPAIDKFTGGLYSAGKGFLDMAKGALAFLATPIGAVIGALGLAIGALTAYFKGSEEGQNNLNKIMKVGTVIFEKFMDVVEAIGGVLFKVGEFFVKGFVKALNTVGITFDSIDKSAQKLADNEAKRDKQERDLIEGRSKIRLQVAKLRKEADESEGARRKELIEEAIALEMALSEQELAAAQTKQEIAQQKADQFGDDKEALKELAEANAALFDAEAAGLENTRKLNKERVSLEEELQKEIKLKRDAAKAERHAQSQDLALEERKISEELASAEVKIHGDAATSMLGITKKLGEETAKAEKDISENTAEQRKKNLDDFLGNAVKVIDAAASLANGITNAVIDHYKVQENELAVSLANEKQLLQDAYKAEIDGLKAKFEAGEISKEEYDEAILGANQRFQADVKSAEIAQAKELDELKRKAFEANKKNQIVQAVADVATAVIRAFASMAGVPLVGQVLGGIAAAATAAFGAIKIAQIKNTEYVPQTFAQGGYTGDGSPTDIAGSVHRKEFVMPAPVVAQFGKDHFQSYLDGAAIANGRAGSSGSGGGSQAPVYVSWKEFTDFKNQMDVKASIVEAA